MRGPLLFPCSGKHSSTRPPEPGTESLYSLHWLRHSVFPLPSSPLPASNGHCLGAWSHSLAEEIQVLDHGCQHSMKADPRWHIQ